MEHHHATWWATRGLFQFHAWFKPFCSPRLPYFSLSDQGSTLLTIQSSSIIEYLSNENQQTASDPYFIMFFYFAFNESDKQSLELFLTSLLYQLCVSQGIPRQLESLYLKYKKLSHSHLTIFKPLKSELVAVLLDSCNSLSKGAFLIMDAMDEIPHGDQREDFLRFLHEIASDRSSKINVLVTSQIEPDFIHQFRWDLGWEIIGLGGARVDQDIALFVHHELNTSAKFSTLSPDDKIRIENFLVENASGV